MQKVSELMGRPIVSSETGERVGKVVDVLLDPHSNHVVGLVTAGGGLLSSEQVLPYADVQTLGKDAVVARSGNGVVGSKEWRQQGVDSKRSSTLKHRRVLTTSGRALGEISDVLLDGTAGTVEAFEVASPAFGGLVQRRSILPRGSGLTIGADAVLVPDEAAGALENPPKRS
jgi:uncharacterized protein YrrD